MSSYIFETACTDVRVSLANCSTTFSSLDLVTFCFLIQKAARGRADFSDANDEVIQTGFSVQNGPPAVVARGAGSFLRDTLFAWLTH